MLIQARRCGFFLVLLVSLFCLSCPLIMPEKVRLIASTELYLPLGSPSELTGIDFDLSALAAVDTGDLSGSGGGANGEQPEMVVSDYPGGYPDIKAFVIKVELIDWPMKDLAERLGTAARTALRASHPGASDEQIDALMAQEKVNLARNMTSNPVTTDEPQKLDIKSITQPLAAYPGLDFATCNAYLYLDGPPSLFEGQKGVTLDFTIKAPAPDPDHEGEFIEGVFLPNKYETKDKRLPRMEVPSWEDALLVNPFVDGPAPMSLAPVLNQPDDEQQRRPVSLAINSSLLVPDKEIPLTELEQHPYLRVYMLLELPLVFDITRDFYVPLNTTTGAEDPPADAEKIIIAEDDLFGRGSDGAGDTGDIIKRLEYIKIEAKAKNNLGLSGQMELNTGANKTLGGINFEGTSVIAIKKRDIIPDPPDPSFKFDLWARIQLLKGGQVKIKRQEQTETGKEVPPLEMVLGVSIKLSLDETF